jgi:hypothetical protein
VDLSAVLPLTAAVDGPSDDDPGAADIPGGRRAVAFADPHPLLVHNISCIFRFPRVHGNGSGATLLLSQLPKL